MAILIPSKVDVRTERATRDKEKHYVILKVSINQETENITILNVCASKNRTSKYMK